MSSAPSWPMAPSRTIVTMPQNHVVNVVTGRCSCSDPETRSGAKG